MAPAPRVRFYRNIVGTFVALNIILLVFVVYLSFVKATIFITPKDVSASKQFIADITAKPTDPTQVPGTVVAKGFEQSKQFEVAGATRVEGRSTGKLIVRNSSGINVTWIAKTRFASADGQIFRIQKPVTIPARKETTIEVIADEPGAAGDVEPGPFTLPAIPDAGKKGIAVESKEPFTGGITSQSAVTQEALDAAKKELTDSVFRDAQTQLATESKGNFTGAAYAYELLEAKSDTVPGTSAAKFTVNVRLKVIGVFYESQSMLALARAKLMESLSEELTLKQINPADVQVELDKYDLTNMIANVKVSASGSANLKEGGSILDKDKLVGLTAAQATDYLKGFQEVQEVSITLRPFWVKSLPKLKDHIDIVIKK